MGFDFDSLYCEEVNLEGDFGSENAINNYDYNVGNLEGSVFYSYDENELVSLFSKEKEPLLGYVELTSNGFVMSNRKGAVEWILRAVYHYGFSVLTCVLAVNYFDRFISSVRFQTEKPWMTQLVAVACLSLAAKVEETQVPLLLDLQVEETKYIFEAKTILKMELLVLSTLKWKMNPVTPLSFVDYVIRRLEMKAHLRLRFMGRCESVLLSKITDPKFGSYLPSALAAGTMLHVLKEVQPDNALDCQNELLRILKMSRDKVDDCYKFIFDLRESYEEDKNLTLKRKYPLVPNSPNGVIDLYLSSDSSNDSWYAAPLVTSSPEPAFKRIRSHEQQMRVAPLRHL